MQKMVQSSLLGNSSEGSCLVLTLVQKALYDLEAGMLSITLICSEIMGLFQQMLSTEIPAPSKHALTYDLFDYFS